MFYQPIVIYLHNFNMISEFFITFVVLWTFLSLLAYRNVTKAFKKYRNVQKLDVPNQWQGFIRQDFGKWDEKAIIKGCFTRFPLKGFLMGSYIFMMGFLATIQRKLYLPFFITELLRTKYGYFVCHYCLNTIEEFDMKEEITTPIIITNHVNWIQLPYVGSCFRIISFVSKKQVKDVPFVNSIAQYGNSLYVDRSNSEGRRQIMEDIKNRVEEFKNNPKQTYPLVIFPQGTVSNGRSILEFKNGAFQSLCPITMLSLRYQCKQFHMGMDEVTTSELSFIAFSLNPTLRVRKTVMTPKQGQNSDEYRERCREKLAEMGGFKIYNANFKDIQAYQAMKKQRRKRETENRQK